MEAGDLATDGGIDVVARVRSTPFGHEVGMAEGHGSTEELGRVQALPHLSKHRAQHGRDASTARLQGELTLHGVARTPSLSSSATPLCLVRGRRGTARAMAGGRCPSRRLHTCLVCRHVPHHPTPNTQHPTCNAMHRARQSAVSNNV